ncbi:protein of unknown function (DUF4262) [Parafrankia irregularis]|uniref:DUF4262 domain-containing protein n=1 Tax=Parafrankia irregularis TaxID=795642 RepID=A0A0S4QLF1_9ACTN|nr:MULTISPECIES: DUF4262 domain-containing protein [Parafrankia]MBE3201189.1 DUF4262 domain-containing protein [Parafrankia sp. CH37]CUU56375.1 protein of unknown function (DUF4262) [Parafrankia irregularis]
MAARHPPRDDDSCDDETWAAYAADNDPATTAWVGSQDALLDQILRTRGWAVQPVIDDGPDEPAYAYTIGLFAFDRHPELVVSGLRDDEATRVLDLLGERVRHHERLHDGQRLTLAPLLTVELRAITPFASDQLLLGANSLYRHPDGPAVPGLQAVWADHTGSLPWEPTWAGPTQPLATAPPAGRGIPGSRVWHTAGRSGPRGRRSGRPLRLPPPRPPRELP